MSSRKITLSAEAYARLKKFKLRGDSFSEVILRELPVPCDTAGEIEDYFREHGVPKADPKLRRMLLGGRERSSPQV